MKRERERERERRGREREKERGRDRETDVVASLAYFATEYFPCYELNCVIIVTYV